MITTLQCDQINERYVIIMTEAIIVALITGGISLIGTLATTRSSAKSTQALVDYKLKELKESVDKHNSPIERTYILEGRMENCEHDIHDIRSAV